MDANTSDAIQTIAVLTFLGFMLWLMFRGD
jgi:hypothetical protein